MERWNDRGRMLPPSETLGVRGASGKKVHPGAGRGCAPVSSSVRAGDPTGEEASGRTAGPWRGRGCLSPGGARPFPAGSRLPATPPQPSAGRGAAAAGPGALRGLPVLRSPRRCPRQGRVTLRGSPAPRLGRPPHSGLYLRGRGSPDSLGGWHLLLRAGSCWQGCSRSKPEACPWRAGRMRPLFFYFCRVLAG